MIILFFSMYLRVCLGLIFLVRARFSLQHPYAMSRKTEAQMHPDHIEISYYFIIVFNYLSVSSYIFTNVCPQLIVLYISVLYILKFYFVFLILTLYNNNIPIFISYIFLKSYFYSIYCVSTLIPPLLHANYSNKFLFWS